MIHLVGCGHQAESKIIDAGLCCLLVIKSRVWNRRRNTKNTHEHHIV